MTAPTEQPRPSRPTPSSAKLPVAVLGATGAVGQTFVRLLADHPWFTLAEVAASEKSAGKTYHEATRWIEGVMPASVRDMVVVGCDPKSVKSTVVFSAIDADAATTIEPAFATAGRYVFSNTKTFRMAPEVPLVIPEVNASHLALIEGQREHGWTGGVVTNANCAVSVAAMALAPLHAKFGIQEVFLSTMQAVSGAGYPGVPSLDILANVIPFIADEEAKLEREIQKILGALKGKLVEAAPFKISAHANRVPVEHGHLVVCSVRFEKKPTIAEVVKAMREWRGPEEVQSLPSAPERPLLVTDLPDRPQPRRDVMAGRGMTVTVGRVRADSLFDLKFVALGHNTIRGAAGGSILNAELLASTGRLGWRPLAPTVA